MRRVGVLIIAVGSILSWTGVAPAGELLIEGGDVSLTVSSATAGQDPDPAVDETTSNLKYSKGGTDPTMKITVVGSAGVHPFTLKVEAINAGAGSPTGEVIVGTTAQDLVTNITTLVFRYCDLRYTLAPLASDGTGADTYTTTYSITAQ